MSERLFLTNGSLSFRLHIRRTPNAPPTRSKPIQKLTPVPCPDHCRAHRFSIRRKPGCREKEIFNVENYGVSLSFCPVYSE